MEPLKEHAHLFSNGKFRVSYDSGHEQLIRKVIGIKRKIRDWALVESDIEGKEGALEIGYCTLIARPIDSLTDKEIESLCDYCDDSKQGVYIAVVSHDEVREDLIERASSSQIDMLEFEWLNNNGFYHGPQSHFDDGTVIDSTTL